MAEFCGFHELARPVQSMERSRDWPSNSKEGKVSMQSFNDMSNRVLAAVSAFAVSAVFFAAAIVPASPAGILV
ncbi:hypothetical protein D2V04_11525 [Pelagerythrobacter aerophilus]|uniref:Recombination protein F n=1 Tax=Pelagerythrobacter aerophilus TaxID=2306995 RepID=A0A418NEP3_9SPHN|nr:hypothetical protein D2V04_11525 [Pelagerythrobacter aerophilus]